MSHLCDLKIETEEDVFWLVVTSETSDYGMRFRISDPEALYDAVRLEIGPWLHERDVVHNDALRAREPKRSLTEFMAFVTTDDGYDPSDPKSADWHSVHADIWDAREGK